MKRSQWCCVSVLSLLFMIGLGTLAEDYTITVQPGESIQAAIDAAQAGDTVHVRAGTYVERITFKSGITLRGEGRDVTTISYSGDAPVLTVRNASSGTIAGFTVRYAGEGNRVAMWVASSRVSILSCTVTGAVYSGIEVRDAGSDVVITDNVIRDNTQSGIFIHSSAYGTVRGNEIYGNGYSGVSARDAGTDPLIEDNVIRDNTQSGIHIYGGAQGTVRGNEIYGNGYNGTSAHGTGTGSVITRNTIVLNEYHGVWVYDEAQATLTNNIIALNGSRGVAGSTADHPDGQVTLSHNNVWGNEAGDYRGVSAHPTDISADPQFVDVDARDFRLRPTSPALPTAHVSSSPVPHDEDQIPSLSNAVGRLEEALMKGSAEDAAQLAHPDRRQDFARAFGEEADALPYLGRGLAHRELISLDDEQALYSVFVPGFGEHLVEFLSSDDTWWLTLWIAF